MSSDRLRWAQEEYQWVARLTESVAPEGEPERPWREYLCTIRPGVDGLYCQVIAYDVQFGRHEIIDSVAHRVNALVGGLDAAKRWCRYQINHAI